MPTHGYHRDADCILYVSSGGVCYLVTEPGSDEPAWRQLDGSPGECLSADAERTRVTLGGMAMMEGCRRVYGIPE